MPKVTFASDIQSISGKLCKKDKVVYAVNKKTGKTIRYDMHERKNPNTTDQQAIRSEFKVRSQAASTFWNANKEIKAKNGTVTREATEDFKKLMKLYDAQSKIGNPYAFLLSRTSKTGTINLGGSTTTGGSSSSGNTGEDRVDY